MSTRSVAEAHHEERHQLARAAEEHAARQWSRVDPDNIVATWAAQVPVLTAVITAAQEQAAAVADAYLDQVLGQQGLTSARAGRVNAAALAGVSSDGRALESLLVRPSFGSLAALSAGHPLDRAMATGLASARMIAATQVTDAGRVADGVALTARRAVPGYVRMASGRTCARCIVLAGRRYRWNDGFRRHPKCDCVHIPSAEAGDDVRTSPKRLFESMSPAEQDQVFTRAGAQAIRDGADIGRVVNARRGMHTAAGRDLTTEAARGRVRLMPEEIYRQAGEDRDEAIRLLRRFGYLR